MSQPVPTCPFCTRKFSECICPAVCALKGCDLATEAGRIVCPFHAPIVAAALGFPRRNEASPEAETLLWRAAERLAGKHADLGLLDDIREWQRRERVQTTSSMNLNVLKDVNHDERKEVLVHPGTERVGGDDSDQRDGDRAAGGARGSGDSRDGDGSRVARVPGASAPGDVLRLGTERAQPEDAQAFARKAKALPVALKWMAEECGGNPDDNDGGTSPRIEGGCESCAWSLAALLAKTFEDGRGMSNPKPEHPKRPKDGTYPPELLGVASPSFDTAEEAEAWTDGYYAGARSLRAGPDAGPVSAGQVAFDAWEKSRHAASMGVKRLRQWGALAEENRTAWQDAADAVAALQTDEGQRR